MAHIFLWFHNPGFISLILVNFFPLILIELRHSPHKCFNYDLNEEHFSTLSTSGKHSSLFPMPAFIHDSPQIASAVYSEKHLHWNYSTSWGLNKIKAPQNNNRKRAIFPIAVLKYVHQVGDACEQTDTVKNGTLFAHWQMPGLLTNIKFLFFFPLVQLSLCKSRQMLAWNL